MHALTGADDVTLAHFLFSLQNDDEIISYLTMYLGESPAVLAFAKEFTLRKRAARGTGDSAEWQTFVIRLCPCIALSVAVAPVISSASLPLSLSLFSWSPLAVSRAISSVDNRHSVLLRISSLAQHMIVRSCGPQCWQGRQGHCSRGAMG